MDPLLLDASSKDMLEGTVAAGLVYTLHIGVPLLVATMALVRALIAGRRGRLADAQCVAGASIEPGSPAVLHGAVELAPGRQVAMRVEIDQRGRQQKTKNGWSHSWTETARRVVAEPFYVMDRRGARVRVEVSERSQLIDAADRVVRTEETARTRIVELSPGEEVYVIGELVRERDPNAGSYRGADTALVMRPPPRGKLLISTERLGDRFRAVARYERISAICFVIFAILFSTFDLGFYARKFRGQREIADVTAFELSTGKNRRCLVEGRFADGETFGGDLTTGWCEDLDAVRDRKSVV